MADRVPCTAGRPPGQWAWKRRGARPYRERRPVVSLGAEGVWRVASTPAVVPGGGPEGLLGWVRRHPLGAFYAVTFLVSWGYWVPDAVSGGHISHTPGLLGPM